MIGRIAYSWEGGDGSAQCGQSVIYDYLVSNCFDWLSQFLSMANSRIPIFHQVV